MLHIKKTHSNVEVTVRNSFFYVVLYEYSKQSYSHFQNVTLLFEEVYRTLKKRKKTGSVSRKETNPQEVYNKNKAMKSVHQEEIV